ncbi:MAG: 30S ribosomal protein S6 [Puniceicoccaceae bacterium]|nr:MAG: 30S ribosomal protein S6 [Puniceicoccaceae bacterium]
MSEKNEKSYKATFILDLRKTEDDAQKVTADISEILTAAGSSVEGSEDLGVRDFARAADQRFTQGHYVVVDFKSSDSKTPEVLKEKLRLDKRVNRIFVEAN